MKREGIRPPKFADKFFRIDFESEPMPVLSLYPVPPSLTLHEVRLELAGLEQHPRSIPWAALKALPRVTMKAPLICQIFNWSEMVEWEGIRLVDVLDFLKIETHPEGYYAFYSRDGVFFEALSRDEARDPRVLLATGLNGAPLPELHGGPLRLVVPFLQGYKSVKWVGKITAFRHDPCGVKRLLGQSPSGNLNDAWREKYGITLPPGKVGDPPFSGVCAPVSTESTAAEEASSSTATPAPPVEAKLAAGDTPLTGPGSHAEAAELVEIMAILRPGKRQATRQALEAVGVVAYTALSVLGRSRQRGLKFKGEPGSGVEDVAIRFLPKHLVLVVVEARQAKAAVQAIIKANATGKGEPGDGRIFVLEIGQALRISTDERGKEAVQA